MAKPESIDGITVAALDALACDVAGSHWPHQLADLWLRISGGRSTRPIGGDAARRWWMAYLLGRHSVYAVRTRHALASAGMSLGGLVRTGSGRVSIADLGCGAGTTTVGLLNELQDACRQTRRDSLDVEVNCCDISDDALSLARLFHSQLQSAGRWPALRIQWTYIKNDMFHVGRPEVDVVAFGHSICEMYQNRSPDAAAAIGVLAARVADVVVGRVGRAGVAILLEPILLNHSAQTLKLRDAIAQDSRVTILGPCPARTNLCPEWSRRRPNNSAPHCGGCTPAIDWGCDDDAGQRLRMFAIAGEIGKPVVNPGRRQFFTLIARPASAEAGRPSGVGTVVMRRQAAPVLACVPTGTDAKLVPISVSFQANSARFSLVTMEGNVAKPLSALYPTGWP